MDPYLLELCTLRLADKPRDLKAMQCLVEAVLKPISRLELENDHARQKAILASAIDFAVVVMDTAGIITDWNSGAEHIMGWAAREMCGQRAAQFFTPEDRAIDRVVVEMRQALRDGRASDERWHLRKDGQRFWASGEMMPLFEEGKGHTGFIKILRDRTDQRHAAVKQQADAAFMHSVLASSADCIKVLNLDATLTFMNEGGMKVMEISNFNDVKGCPWPDFWTGQGNLEAVAALEAAKAGGIGHFQGAAKTYLGTQKWWDVQVTPICGQDGRPTKLLAVSRDISSQKSVETQLALSEARWRGLFDGMQEGFFLGELIRDADGHARDYRFLEINPAFAHQSGLPADSIGRTIRSFVPDIDQGLIDHYATAVETGQPVSFEIEVPSLTRIFEVRASKEQEDRFSCLFLDITARKQADKRRAAVTELGDVLRDATSVLEITTKAAEIVGRTLDGSRAGYGEMDAACESVTILWDASVTGETSLVGRHRFANYDAVAPDIEHGDPVAVDDVAKDPRTAKNLAVYAAINLRAMLNVPVQEHGRTVGLIFVHSPVVRVWTPEDITFARSVADRVQSGIARLNAEEQLARAQEQLRLAIDATGVGVFDYDPKTGALACDARARAMFEMPLEQALTYADFLVVVHPGDRTWVDAAIQAALDPAGDRNYDITYRTIGTHDGHERWVNGKGQAFPRNGQIVRCIGTLREVTETKIAEAQQDMLNHELSHRLKNTLAMVQAIARQTLKNATDPQSADETLSARLVALGRAHDVLLTGKGESAAIQMLIASALELHDDGGAERFVLQGPVIDVGEKAALPLSLVFHELATNATKYGALSVPGGRVRVIWTVDHSATGKIVQLIWQEHNGPPVQPPTRRGFGSRLIERGLSGSVGGKVAMDYPIDGVICTLTAPLAGLKSRF